MSGEEPLENLFQSGVALLEQGVSPARAAQALKLDGTVAEIVPLLQIVDASFELPRYQMPAAAQAALLARLIEQTKNRVVPLAVLQPATEPTEPVRLTPPPDRQQVRWAWFLRVQQAVVAVALVLAIGFIIIQANGGKGTNPSPTNPAATVVPSPVITPTPAPELPQPTPAPNITTSPEPSQPPEPTSTRVPPTNTAITTGEPTARDAVITQSDQANTNKSATRTVPPAPTGTARITQATKGPAAPPRPVLTNTAKSAPTATTAPPATVTAVPTATPTPTPTSQVVAPPATMANPNPTATPDDAGDDHGGGDGKGSTKTPSPTPAPTNTPKPNGKG